MDKYGLDKVKCFIFVTFILLILLAGINFSLLTSIKIVQALIFCAVILWPFAILLIRIAQSLKNYIIVTDDYIVFKERGVREKKISWDTIEQIQFRGFRLFPITNTMVIHFKTPVSGLNNKYMTIDYFYKNYKELWTDILRKYTSKIAQCTIDPSFKKVIKLED